jgi:hypothetical protein
VSPCFVLAAICGPAADPPPTAVQPTVELRLTSVDDGAAKLLEDELRRALSDRLLQDGYRVVPGGQAASVAIWVHLGPEGARVRAHGVEERVETIAAGDPEVVALEVLQLTTALVDEVRPLEPVDRPAVALQVEGRPVDPELRERLQVGLLERGYALTRTPGRADARLCVVAAGDQVQVHATAADRGCEAEAAGRRVAAAETVELRRVLLLDEAAAALDERARAGHATGEAATSERASAREAAEVASPAVSSPVTEPAPAERRDDARVPSLAITVHGGLVARSGGPDGAFGMRLRAGRQRGLGGGLELTVVPSSAAGLRVVESMPTALFDWTLGFGRRGIAGFGALAGVHVHAFRQAGPVGVRGLRLAPSFGTTVRLGILGRRGLVAFGGLRVGWSGGRWVHVLDGESTWERSRLLVGAELGVGWDFAWRPRA